MSGRALENRWREEEVERAYRLLWDGRSGLSKEDPPT